MFNRDTEKIFLEGVEKRRIFNSITLHIIPTANGLNWKTPKDIFKSVLKNKATIFKARWPIGHVSVEVCDSQGDISYIGQTTQEFELFTKMVLKEHLGFRAIIDDVSGSLQNLDELKKNYGKLMTKKNQIAFVTFKLPAQKIERLKKYIKEYDEKKGWHRYGLPNKPLLGEGAGCSAFASSCFQVLGLMKLTKNWSRIIYIPNRLIGSNRNSVHAFKLLREGSLNWTVKLPDAYKLLFYDPELMWEWLNTPKVQSQVSETYKVAQTQGFVLDYTNLEFEKECDWHF